MLGRKDPVIEGGEGKRGRAWRHRPGERAPPHLAGGVKQRRRTSVQHFFGAQLLEFILNALKGAVAGKFPSMMWPSAAFVSALYLVRRPNGVPCAVDTK